MKKALTIYLCLCLLPLFLFSQNSMKYKAINVATTFNYYPTVEPYSFFSNHLTNTEELWLTFRDATSGTFVIEEGDVIQFSMENINHLPSQLLGIGASVQIVNHKSLFHEVSITKLSVAKSSYISQVVFNDEMGEAQVLNSSFEQRALAFGLRYEIGRYFGKRKNPALRFGLSGALEPSLYSYKKTPLSSDQFPLQARIFSIDIALIPIVSANISKKISLDFKLIPNILLADFGSVTVENPILSIDQRKAIRTYNPPDINVAFSILLRYQVKAAQKRRRRQP